MSWVREVLLLRLHRYGRRGFVQRMPRSRFTPLLSESFGHSFIRGKRNRSAPGVERVRPDAPFDV
jgi:hypothetical protein